VWRPLARLYFYPMMVPGYLFRVLISPRGHYFSDVDEGVLLGAVPLWFAGHPAQLHADGVRAVVNMMDEYPGALAAYATLRPPIEQLRLPCVDHVEPTVAQLRAAVAFIALHRQRGVRVLVHCKGGHGRGAAVAAAWLLSPHGGTLTPAEAQVRLNSCRHVRTKLLAQRNLTQYYAEVHGAAGAAEASGGDAAMLDSALSGAHSD
jgi:atypical dual specificity phosphatase